MIKKNQYLDKVNFPSDIKNLKPSELKSLVKEVRELKQETSSLRADINKGKGAVWLLLVIAAVITSGYNYFIK